MKFSKNSHKNDAKKIFLKGRHHHQKGEYAKAESFYKDVLKLIPHQPDALHMLGVAAFQQDRFEESERYIAKAIKYGPEAALVFYNYGNTLRKLGRIDEAKESFNTALALEPTDVATLENLGNIHKELNQFKVAHQYYDRLLELDPKNVTGRSNKAIALLTQGRLKEGWEHYSDRLSWRKPGQNLVTDAIPRQAPEWDGKKTAKPLLILPEQGIGDQIFYGNILNDIVDDGIESFVCIDNRLLTLFKRSFPSLDFATPSQIANLDPGLNLFSAQTMIGSLGKWYRQNLSDARLVKTPYLFCDNKKKSELKEKLSGDHYLNVGISWKSMNTPYSDSKSCRLDDLLPILTLPNINLIDLQYGDTLVEREYTWENFDIKINKLADIDNTADIDNLANLISACDIVVSISNSTAHLACALGKPTLVLLPWHSPLWYWHTEEIDSPWYPTAVLLRQQKAGNWSKPVETAANILADLCLRSVEGQNFASFAKKGEISCR